MNHIGCDVHIKTIDFAVVNERGIVSKQGKVETGERNIFQFVTAVGKPRVVIIEEGTLANWMKSILERRGEQVVITDPRENRWIGKCSQKGDRLDAEKLAKLHYGGYTKEIIHLRDELRWFKELVFYYHDQVKSQTRLKNKIKAKFRQNGIRCGGKTVYDEKHREAWLKQLPQESGLKWQVEGLLNQLYSLDQHIKQTKERMKQGGRSRPEIRRMRKINGIDWINACTISAIVGDIRRFSNKKKLWMYGGLGMMKRESGGQILESHLSRDYNRHLKCAFKTAARAAVRSKDNPYRRQYNRLTMEQGILPHRAILTVARSIAATVYGVWKQEKDFEPKLREIKKVA